MNLIAQIRKTLSNAFAMYVQSHGAHWNVIGPGFQQYHELFQEIYEDVYNSIDSLSEFLRKLGQPSPFGLQDFMAEQTVVDGHPNTDPASLVMYLLTSNDVVLNDLNTLFTMATNANQQGVANFVAERIDMHQKWKWQLSASIGREVSSGSTSQKKAVVTIAQGMK